MRCSCSPPCGSTTMRWSATATSAGVLPAKSCAVVRGERAGGGSSGGIYTCGTLAQAHAKQCHKAAGWRCHQSKAHTIMPRMRLRNNPSLPACTCATPQAAFASSKRRRMALVSLPDRSRATARWLRHAGPHGTHVMRGCMTCWLRTVAYTRRCDLSLVHTESIAAAQCTPHKSSLPPMLPIPGYATATACGDF